MSEKPTGEQGEEFDSSSPSSSEPSANIGAHSESKARDDAALWDMTSMESSLDLYAQEFDSRTKDSYERRFAEQERQNRYAKAAEKRSQTETGREGAAGTFPSLFSGAGSMEPSFGFGLNSANYWGVLGIMCSFWIPLFGIIFGFLGLRKARVVGTGRVSAIIALSLASVLMATNLLLILTGAVDISELVGTAGALS